MTDTFEADIEELLRTTGTGASAEVQAATLERSTKQFEEDCRRLGITGVLDEVELAPTAKQFLAPVDTLHMPDDLLKPRHLG